MHKITFKNSNMPNSHQILLDAFPFIEKSLYFLFLLCSVTIITQLNLLKQEENSLGHLYCVALKEARKEDKCFHWMIEYLYIKYIFHTRHLHTYYITSLYSLNEANFIISLGISHWHPRDLAYQKIIFKL